MANQNQEKNKSTPGSGSLADAARLAKDVGRVFAGDMSAIKDLLMNKLVWEIILCVALVISLVGMIIGGSVAAILEYIARCWEENWEANWEEQAIASNGDIVGLETTGWWKTLGHTLEDTIGDLLSGCFSQVTSNGIAAGAGRDNSNINDADIQAAGRNPEETDYETTIKAIQESTALSKALTDRLDMIKGRVKQRGMQIEKAVKEQYLGRNSTADAVEKWVKKTVEDGVIDNGDSITVFVGYDSYISKDNINIDTSAFELTDLQAIKILAIFCVQHDCQLTEMDMWTLMDYCGWFNSKVSEGNLDDYTDSIYAQVTPNVSTGTDMGDVGFRDDVIIGIEFPSLQVPIWDGTCAPQWYYEELAQIRKHNENLSKGEMPWGVKVQYGSLTYAFQTIELPAIPSKYVVTNDSEWYYYEYKVVDKSTGVAATCVIRVGEGMNRTTNYNGVPVERYVFTDLKPDTEYEVIYTLCKSTPCEEGIIYDNNYDDRFNYSPDDTRTVIQEMGVLESFTTQSLYGSASGDIQIDNFFKLKDVETFGIIDKLYYSIENNITVNHLEYNTTTDWTREELEASGLNHVIKYWEDYVWAVEHPTAFAGTVYRDAEGNHSYVHHEQVMNTSETKNIIASTDYYQIVTIRTLILKENLYGGNYTVIGEVKAFTDPIFTGLKGSTNYSVWVREVVHTRRMSKDGNLISSEITSDDETQLNTFITAYDKKAVVLYGLYTAINITFDARSVDDIAFELLGIWPGYLEDTVKVTKQTSNLNLIGKNIDKETGKANYSYCLIGGTLNLVHQKGPNVESGYYQTLMRPRTVSTTNEPLSTTVYVYEYGIHSLGKLSKVSQTPESGWKMVAADGDHLIFNIKQMRVYYVYLRISIITKTLQEDGTVVTTSDQYLYQIDEVYAAPSDDLSDGTLYANGQLGNELLLRSWTDLCWDEANKSWMTIDPITFERQQGFQYENYVDMVMALCKLLGVSYDSWDPAVQRAQELKLPEATTP